MADLYDAHLHLQHPSLAPHRVEIVQTMESLPVRAAVVNGTTEADWPTVRALAERYPWVIPAYGLHPWYIDSRTPEWEEKLEALLATDPRATVGEIGLDRWMRHPDRVAQRDLFLRQLQLAREYQRPASIHCLRAWGTLMDLLRHEPFLPGGFLLHAYAGPIEMIDEFVNMGAYFSFSGYFLTPGKEYKIQPFLKIPHDRLLIETDAPSMPLPHEWLRYPLPNEINGTEINHPGNITAVYEGLAEALAISQETLASIVSKNFQRLFYR